MVYKNSRELLSYALDTYGKLAVSTSGKEKAILDSVSETVDCFGVNIKKIREIFVDNGQILEENIDQQYYIATVDVGFINRGTALVVCMIFIDKIDIGAYAKEPLIKQHYARKAIDLIKEKMMK